MPCIYALIPYYSKYLGVATTGILTGILLTHSSLATPLLLTSPNHEIILRQFRLLQEKSGKPITHLAILSSAFYLTASYIRATKSWPTTIRCWVAGFLTLGVIPYRYLVMRRTEKKLELLYQEEVEGMDFEVKGKEGEVVVKGEVRQLVDWWGVVNLGRVFGAGAAFLVGLSTLKRR
ncbi:hypothetical protein TWF281_002436 [Arthrobotrys megalospora]